MKPKAANENDEGLLEYLEDIIGTSQYKEPIDKALVEVERLTEDRQEKLNRLRIVDKDRKALEAKKREAEDYLRMVNDLVRARSRLWQWYIWKCLVNEAQLEEKIVGVILPHRGLPRADQLMFDRAKSSMSCRRSESAIRMTSITWRHSRSTTTTNVKPTRYRIIARKLNHDDSADSFQ